MLTEGLHCRLLRAVGTMQLTYDDSLGYCTQDPLSTSTYMPAPLAASPPPPPPGAGSAGAGAAPGGHLKWWIALIIGLAGGGVLLGGLAGLGIWYGLRWKHSKEAAAFQLGVKSVWFQSRDGPCQDLACMHAKAG
jgi:hypothetical protein